MSKKNKMPQLVPSYFINKVTFALGYVKPLSDINSNLIIILAALIFLILSYGALAIFILNRELGLNQRLEWHKSRRGGRHKKAIDFEFLRARLPFHQEDSILFYDRFDSEAKLIDKIFEKHNLRKVDLTIDGVTSTYLVMCDISTPDFIHDTGNVLHLKLPDLDYIMENNIVLFNNDEHLFNIIVHGTYNELKEFRLKVAGNRVSVGNVGNQPNRPTITWPHVS